MRESSGVSLGALGLVAFSFAFAGVAEAQTFTNWMSVLRANSTVSVGGVSQEFTSTGGASGVTSVSAPSTNLAATLTETLNANADPIAFTLANGNRNVSFNAAYGDGIQTFHYNKLLYALSSDWTRKALVAQPIPNGWQYQTFGVWTAGLGMAAGSMGSVSVGAITAGTSVPQTGSASFGGLMAGIYNDRNGQDHLIRADMGLKVDFGAHRADFWTVNTYDNLGHDYEDLNITGVFVSLANHPALFGSLVAGELEGTSSAQFYGPAAEEVGGVFTMTPRSGKGLERLAGAFGGKRGAYAPPQFIPAPAGSFTSWAENAKPGGSVLMSGEAFVAAGRGITPTELVQASLTTRLDPFGEPLSYTASAPGLTVSFDKAVGDSFVFHGVYEVNDSVYVRRGVFGVNGATSPRIKDGAAVANNYNYQTFGIWQQEGNGAGLGDLNVAAGSFGAATPAGAIPTGGDVRFAGEASLIYTYPNGATAAPQTSSVLVDVSFAGRSAHLTNAPYTYGPFVISGDLTWQAGQNRLTGILSSSTLSGPVYARFFGPAATELGGVFSLGTTAGSGSQERIVGAFGARRPN